MHILKEGDKKKVACECCGSFQTATFQLRDVLLSDGSGVVKNVLAGVCDNCGTVVIIPQQSTPAIQKQMEVQRKAIETRVPAHFVDILALASIHIGATPDFSQNLVKYYIHALSTGEISPSGLGKLLDSDLAKGKASKRISLKGRHVDEELNALCKLTRISSTTDVLKSVVLKINDDILVHERPKVMRTLQSVVAATA